MRLCFSTCDACLGYFLLQRHPAYATTTSSGHVRAIKGSTHLSLQLDTTILHETCLQQTRATLILEPQFVFPSCGFLRARTDIPTPAEETREERQTNIGPFGAW